MRAMVPEAAALHFMNRLAFEPKRKASPFETALVKR